MDAPARARPRAGGGRAAAAAARARSPAPAPARFVSTAVKADGMKATITGDLTLNVTAKTYRYLDDEESSDQQAVQP